MEKVLLTAGNNSVTPLEQPTVVAYSDYDFSARCVDRWVRVRIRYGKNGNDVARLIGCISRRQKDSVRIDMMERDLSDKAAMTAGMRGQKYSADDLTAAFGDMPAEMAPAAKLDEHTATGMVGPRTIKPVC